MTTTLLKPAAPLRAGRRERRRAETRERLFRAALALFADRGFNATTVEHITEAADVGKGTFFNYFPSKEHVLAAFGEMQLGKVRAALERVRQSRGSVQPILDRLVDELAEEPSRSPALVRSLMIANLSSEPVRQIFRHNLERGRAVIAELFALAQARGEISRQISPSHLARALQQMFFGGLMLWSIHPPSRLSAWLHHALDLLWSGVASTRRKAKA